MDTIIHPVSLEQLSIFDNKGKNLLKKYVHQLRKIGGTEPKLPNTLKNVCQTALYGRKKPNNKVQTSCKIHNYSNDHLNSIEFIKKSKEIKDTKFVEKVAEKTMEVINKHVGNKQKRQHKEYTSVLGPVEDILGFFIKYVSKKREDSEFKKIIVLSVKDNIWSTDFNYDFINCSINTGKTDKDNFDRLSSELPIVLLNIGNKSILEGHNPKELLTKLPRVTQCEIEWVREKMKATSYKWKTEKILVDKQKVWVNMLKKVK
jgi:hypothetical protein